MRSKLRDGRAVWILSGVWAALLMPPVAAQEQFDRGRALYEHHCMSCHESWAHTREGRHVRTLAELRRRTEAWSVHSRLEWSREEIDDVADYLDRAFYHLDETP
ncbi:MAG: cytochrome c [Gammaproteobacteria bacterium]